MEVGGKGAGVNWVIEATKNDTNSKFIEAIMSTCIHNRSILHLKRHRQMCINSGSNIRSPVPI